MKMLKGVQKLPKQMFVERWASSSALYTLLVGWHVSVVSLPPGDVILAQLACPLNGVTICLYC
jgi:hypothetical protein